LLLRPVILYFSIGCPDRYERFEENWTGLEDVKSELCKSKQTPITYLNISEEKLKVLDRCVIV